MAREVWVCLERTPVENGGLDTVLRGVFTKKVRAQNAGRGEYVFIIPVRLNQVLTSKELERLHANV